MTASVFVQTNFNDPNSFGEPHIDVLSVLKTFATHPHLVTRNACLEALKRGKTHDLFGHRRSGGIAEEVALFELIISSLNSFVPRAYGEKSQHAQQCWYRDTTETFVDVYLYFAKRCCAFNSGGEVRAIQFLFDLQSKRPKPVSDSEALKLTTYYLGRYLFLQTVRARGGVCKIEGLAEFLAGYLDRFTNEVLRDVAVTKDQFDPINRILKFIATHSYFESGLQCLLVMLKKSLELRASQSFTFSREEGIGEQMLWYESSRRGALYTSTAQVIGTLLDAWKDPYWTRPV